MYRILSFLLVQIQDRVELFDRCRPIVGRLSAGIGVVVLGGGARGWT